MEWFGFVALAIVLCYSSYPGKVKNIEARMKRIERKQRGGNDMLKLIGELVNKKCKIKMDDTLETEIKCLVMDADDEWLKVCVRDKKNNQITKLIRIENIDEVKIMDDEDRAIDEDSDR